MSRLTYSLAGAALATVSALTLIRSVPASKGKTAAKIAVTAGVFGLIAGISILTNPEKPKPQLSIQMDDDDVDLVEENINEVLGKTVEKPEKKILPDPIELDEETSIEDFLA